MVLGFFTLGACVTVESDVPTVDWSEDETISGTTVETVARGFDHPWGLAWLPDRSMLITERGGRLWLLSPDGETRQEVDNPPEVFTGGQAGLLDISVAPDYADSGWIYLTYAAGTRTANRTEVARARLDQSAPDAPRLVDRELIAGVNAYKSGTQHFGSRIAWLPDGTMLVSIGDGGNPPLRFDGGLQREQAQEEDTLFGSVIRLNPDGTIPADAEDAFFTIGHRNIQGMAVDPADGTLYAGGLQSEALHVVTITADRSFGSHRVLPIGARVRNVRLGPDDQIYLLTDESLGGRVLRVSLP